LGMITWDALKTSKMIHKELESKQEIQSKSIDLREAKKMDEV